MSQGGDRYARQVRLPMIGEAGQAKVRAGHALIVGCGALGTAAAEFLARAGVGTITLVDRDVVALSNLQRQLLFDEEDAARGLPKVEAAKARLHRINREVRVRAFFDDFAPRNAERYGEGVDVIVDGLDNLETRYLLNDLAVMREIPYIYGAAVGSEGMHAAILPAGEGRAATPCLRCLFPELPPAGTLATCESAGVLGTITALVAALEATQAIKLLVGARDAVEPGLLAIDLWTNGWRRIDTRDGRDADCPCCGKREFDFLDGSRIADVTVLCGSNAVQLAPSEGAAVDLEALLVRFAEHHDAARAGDAVSCTLRDLLSPDGHRVQLTVFADGRVVVRGTREPEFARSIVARFVGA